MSLKSQVNCVICIEFEFDFYTCNTCSNKHCMTCHTKIQKCPFCRTKFDVSELELQMREFFHESYQLEPIDYKFFELVIRPMLL